MNNYVYIVSSLPVLTPDSAVDTAAILEEILSQCSEADRERISFLLDGFEGKNLTPDFYRKALGSDSAFLREYFRYDLAVRNLKARYLNREFGRDEEADTIVLGDETPDFEDAPRVQEILGGSDILGREKGLDQLMWAQIDALTTFHYFDLDAILGFVARLKITDRWLKLDEQTGREMFRRLTEQVRATFKGVEFEG